MLTRREEEVLNIKMDVETLRDMDDGKDLRWKYNVEMVQNMPFKSGSKYQLDEIYEWHSMDEGLGK